MAEENKRENALKTLANDPDSRQQFNRKEKVEKKMDDSGFVSPTYARDENLIKPATPTSKGYKVGSPKKRKSQTPDEAEILAKSPKKVDDKLSTYKFTQGKKSQLAITQKEEFGVLFNERHVTKTILSVLPVNDLLRCSAVSRSWKKTIQICFPEVEKYKNQRRKEKLEMEENKENSCTRIIEKAQRTPNKDVPFKPAENLPPRFPQTPKKSQTLSPVTSLLRKNPGLKNRTEEIVRRHLEPEDQVKNCIFCGHPSRKTINSRGICYNENCKKKFCFRCRLEHEVNAACRLDGPVRRALFKKTSPQKLKQSLKRL